MLYKSVHPVFHRTVVAADAICDEDEKVNPCPSGDFIRKTLFFLFSTLSPALNCRFSTRLLKRFSFQTQLCLIYPDFATLAAR
jgi:hypothetical protein